MKIVINGEESGLSTSGLGTMGDLVELVKNTIDPEHMIASLMLNGKELKESDWNAGLNSYQTAVLEVHTCSVEQFVENRLSASADILGQCLIEFQEARKQFQDGAMQDGNKRLIGAVGALKAFFEWYATVVELIAEEKRGGFSIDERVAKLSVVCKKICQQQLYQSWWALGETIQSELEPGLTEMEEYCRHFSFQEQTH